ncbi:MAG: hypothetical protein RIK87_08675 [Fuerstiella sp.]
MKKLVLAACTAALVSVYTVSAQPPGGGRGPEGGPEAMVDRMMSLDKDDDGKLSKEEVPERLQSLFARADRNEDGFLTKEEIGADLRNREGRGFGGPPGDGEGRRGEGRRGEGRPQDGEGRGRGFGGGPGRMPPFPVMMTLDANQDGELSADEINNATAALKKLDKNGDGKLDHEELRPNFGDRSPGEGAGGRPGRGFGGPPGGGEGRGNMADFMLTRFDQNKDGKLARDELPEPMQERFARMDRNEDSFVDRAELEEVSRQFGGRGGRGPGGEGGERRRPPIEE